MKVLSILSLLCCGTFLNVSAQSFLKFSGKVTDTQGKGIAGIVVNDGRHFVKTDTEGTWALESDTAFSKFISISTPSGYQLPQKEGLADGFFVSVNQLAKSGGNHTFVLQKRQNVSDDFYYIAVSDPQVRNEHEMKRWRQETVVDLVEVIDSLKQTREVVGMTLGDEVFDNMSLYDEYKES